MEPIPSPPRTPLLGHLPLIFGDSVIQAVMNIVAEHGPIVHLSLKHELVVLSSAELVAEVLSHPHDKCISAPLEELRAVVGDALFTAHTDEPNWGRAHEILVPAFRRQSMALYYEAMLEMAEAMLTSWDSLPDGARIDVPEQMTRLTFDTIGLCGFGYRFDSFGRADAHPFVGSMTRARTEALYRVQVPRPLRKLRFRANRGFAEDQRTMNDTVDALIRQRRAGGETTGTDLLDRMLTESTKDGERLDDVNIRNQILTFLIAGHETTSGALSFALHYLLQDPELLARTVAEVDFVLGDVERPSWEQVKQLKLVGRVLKEGLRLWPTAPAFSVELDEDTVIAGRWLIPAKRQVLLLLPALHRDPDAWEEPERFDPDRFLRERERKRPPHAYKPFGHGQRACIGAQFATLEATLVLGLVLRRYRLEPDPDYELSVHETLTVKPRDLFVRLHRRDAPEASP